MIFLLVLVPICKLADGEEQLVIGATLFFVHLVVFVARGATIEPTGLVCNLGGIFNTVVVAQFWAYAGDVLTIRAEAAPLSDHLALGSV